MRPTKNHIPYVLIMLRLANSSYTYVVITNTGYSYVAAWREGSGTLYYLVQPV